VSDWTRELLWPLGAFVVLAVLAKLCIIGIQRCVPSRGTLESDLEPTLWSVFGIRWRQCPANVARGLTVFIWLTPVVLCIHVAFSTVLWDRPHALSALRSANLSTWEWALVAFQTCLAVPVIEEVLFRGVLQYWLGQTSLVGHLAVVLATLVRAAYGVAYHDATADKDVIDAGPVIFAVLLVGGYLFAFYCRKFMSRLTAAEVRGWKPIATDVRAELAFFEHEARREQEWRTMTSMLSTPGPPRSRSSSWASVSARLRAARGV
jgi:hypothetical protein